MHKKIRKLISKTPIKKSSDAVEKLSEAAAAVPRITNETVAEHREEVLSSARKYIYPLQHSKHKIILITTTLFIALVVAFFGYTTIALYRLKSYSSFLYGVTQVIPFPVAKAGGSYVAYENYLFELKHYIHYYQNEQKLDFKSDSGKQQLAEFKKRALDRVVNDAYIKQLAAKNKVSVSDAELDQDVALVRSQNRLGGSDKAFEDTLKEFYGWSLSDFKRSRKQILLAQKLLPKLDTQNTERADAALRELKLSNDFGAVAKKYTDDTSTKDNGGEFVGLVDKTNRDLAAKTTSTLFELKPGQYSDVINTGTALEIVKNIENRDDKVRGAHIVFTFKDINIYLNDLKDSRKARLYITP